MSKTILQPGSILCSDGLTSFRAYTRLNNIQHVRLRQKKHKERIQNGIYHIQNVNNFHRRFKQWLARFNGVASQYLSGYVAWFRYYANVSEHVLPKDPLFLFKSLVLQT